MAGHCRPSVATTKLTTAPGSPARVAKHVQCARQSRNDSCERARSPRQLSVDHGHAHWEGKLVTSQPMEEMGPLRCTTGERKRLARST
eukprot:52877-Pyramimonas_sp.AAC.1